MVALAGCSPELFEPVFFVEDPQDIAATDVASRRLAELDVAEAVMAVAPRPARRAREEESVLARRPAQVRRIEQRQDQLQVHYLVRDEDFLGPAENARFERRKVEDAHVPGPQRHADRERGHLLVIETGPLNAAKLPPIKGIEEVAKRGLQRAIVGLVINGREVGDSIVFIDGKDIIVPLELLRRGGIVAQVPVERDVDGTERVSLSRLGGAVRFHIDDETVKLIIDAGAELFDASYISLAPRRPIGIIYTDDTSAFLNYGVRGNSEGAVGLATELGVHIGEALLLVTADLNDARGLVRGLSQIVVDDVDNLHRWTAGDAFASNGALGGSTFLAGLTLEKTFALDPYQALTPSLSFDGAVTTPSSLEVWVDGVFVKRVDLEPGTFRVADLPAPTMSGNATYIVRDAMGRTQTFNQPYNMSAGLLAPGVHEYAFSAGFERKGVGYESFDYRTPVALARHRVGVGRNVTVGWSAETAPLEGLVGASARATFASPIGRFEVGAAASHNGGQSGAALTGSWDYASRGFGISTFAVARTRDFAVVGGEAGHGAPTLELGGRVTVSDRSWRFGLDGRYQHTADGLDITRGSASFAVQPMSGFTIGVRGGVEHGREPGLDWQMLATVSVSPGAFTATASQRVDQDAAETALNVSVPIRDEYGLGTQASASFGETVRLRATQEARTAYGRLRGDLSYDAAGFSCGGEFAGGLVFVEGAGLHATRPINGGFAIVELPTEVDAVVMRENRKVGSTSSGYLVVPDLLSYYGNRLSMVLGDVPMDFEVGETERVVAPPYRGGARVAFSLIRTSYVRGFVQRVEGTLGYGTLIMRLGDETRRSPLGANGEFELQGARPGKWEGVVEHRDGQCEVEIEIPDTKDPVLQLGVFMCRLFMPAPDGQPRKPLPLAKGRGDAGGAR
jgi:outer membrane usher protein